MPDDAQDPRKKKSLSEISHLFLSSIRDRQTNGAKPPQRTPPPTDPSIDLTPEEFAQVYGSARPSSEAQRKIVPVTALISAHLNGKQFDRVKEYARHLASRVGRVGLIEADASELRLMCFEPGAPSNPTESDPAATDCAEPRRMSEALEEMNWDVERWLLLLPNPRTCEAKALLREADHWVLLSTCDHDGVVSSYRMLKSVADAGRPRLSLALLDAADDATVAGVYAKLAGVCQQFLDWPLEAEPAVERDAVVNEFLVLQYRPTHNKAQLAAAPQWGIVADFLAATRPSSPQSDQPAPAPQAEDEPMTTHEQLAAGTKAVPDPVVARLRAAQQQVTSKADVQPSSVADVVIPMPRPSAATAEPAVPRQGFDEVIDLEGCDVSGGSLLSAVLRHAQGGLVECPVRPPMCPEARLAVGREHGMVLLAVARQGLGDLRAIAQAYRWMNENRELIGMALPQFAIDSRQSPTLQLFVDRADLSADVLQPLLQSQNVTVQVYRKLRWGEKLGVFLEAA